MIKDNNIIDIPFGTKHIRFENLSKEQIECLIKLSETHQLSSIRKSTLILTEGPKQETLEEAAKNYAIDNSLIGYELMPYKGFIEGAKWQAGRSYSEEDMIKAIKFGELSQLESSKSLFEKRGIKPKEAILQFIETFKKVK